MITDPPYFDFVHYSELSDFFFAWLAPALKDRYAWFDKRDCADTGEVQHKDPRRLVALQLPAFDAAKPVENASFVLDIPKVKPERSEDQRSPRCRRRNYLEPRAAEHSKKFEHSVQ